VQPASVAQWKSSSVLRKRLGVRVPPGAPLGACALTPNNFPVISGILPRWGNALLPLAAPHLILVDQRDGWPHYVAAPARTAVVPYPHRLPPRLRRERCRPGFVLPWNMAPFRPALRTRARGGRVGRQLPSLQNYKAVILAEILCSWEGGWRESRGTSNEAIRI
jgi:hypothetical protein